MEINKKRLFDVGLIILSLPILFIVFIVLLILVKIKLGHPVFFCQLRPGLHGAVFKMIKFRSMLDAVDEKGNVLPDSERLTAFGKKLRSSSLDELPGLWNVLKGDMSLVGPRPLLVEYLPLYSNEQARRHEVRPGITGWAQINGRNAITWEQKFKYDKWYVDNYSFLLDLKIIFLTLVKVIKSEGVSPDDDVIMPRFTGNKD